MSSIKEKFYTIVVDGRYEPVEVEFGELNKQTMQPIGTPTKMQMQVGSISIPNFSRVWGKLGLNKEKQLDGKVEFLKWGDPAGEVVSIRFHPSSASLSQKYQDLIEKQTLTDDMIDIKLEIGVNEYHPIMDARLIEMLKHHTFNGGNKSRNPDNIEILYHELDSKKAMESEVNRMEQEQKARQVILDNRDDEGVLTILSDIFNLENRSQTSIMFRELSQIVKDNPAYFNHRISEAKEEVVAAYKKAEGYGLLDEKSVKDEVILLSVNGSKEKLFNGMDGSKDRSKWVAENMMDTGVYDAINKMKEASVLYEREMKDK